MANGKSPYAGGFSTVASLIGSRYIIPAPGVRVLQFANSPDNGVVSFEQAAPGGAPGLGGTPLPQVITLFNNNTVLAAGRRLTLSISLQDGLFSGTVSGLKAEIPYHGAVFQRQNMGAGWFIGSGYAGTVTLEPWP